MSRFRQLEDFLVGLRTARLFEEAASRTLAAMLAEVSSVLAAGPWASRAKLARGMVHLRPSSGYRQLAVLEVGSDEVVAPQPDSTRLPSMTAWRTNERVPHRTSTVENLVGRFLRIES